MSTFTIACLDMGDPNFQKARDLLWALVQACSERMAHAPHATVALARERDHYALTAIRLTPGDTAHIDTINNELPRRLQALHGPIT